MVHSRGPALPVAQLCYRHPAVDAHPRAVATVHSPTAGVVLRQEGSGEETRKCLNQLNESEQSRLHEHGSSMLSFGAAFGCGSALQSPLFGSALGRYRNRLRRHNPASRRPVSERCVPLGGVQCRGSACRQAQSAELFAGTTALREPLLMRFGMVSCLLSVAGPCFHSQPPRRAARPSLAGGTGLEHVSGSFDA